MTHLGQRGLRLLQRLALGAGHKEDESGGRHSRGGWLAGDVFPMGECGSAGLPGAGLMPSAGPDGDLRDV